MARWDSPVARSAGEIGDSFVVQLEPASTGVPDELTPLHLIHESTIMDEPKCAEPRVMEVPTSRQLTSMQLPINAESTAAKDPITSSCISEPVVDNEESGIIGESGAGAPPNPCNEPTEIEGPSAEPVVVTGHIATGSPALHLPNLTSSSMAMSLIKPPTEPSMSTTEHKYKPRTPMAGTELAAMATSTYKPTDYTRPPNSPTRATGQCQLGPILPNSGRPIQPNDSSVIYSGSLETLLFNLFLRACAIGFIAIVGGVGLTLEFLSPVFEFVWTQGVALYWYMAGDSLPKAKEAKGEWVGLEVNVPWFFGLGCCWIFFVVGMLRTVWLLFRWITFGDVFMCFLFALQ